MFRINAKNIFLTYSQCTLDGNDLLVWLTEKEPTAHFIRVAAEKHASGDPHLHAILRYKTKRDIRNARHFDHDDFHPKIEPCKSVAKSLKYLEKDGEFYDFDDGEEVEATEVPQTDDFACKKDFLIACYKEGIPYGYANEWWRISETIDKHIYEESEGSISSEVLLSSSPMPGVSTVCLGETGIGKTTWAIKHAEKPALLVSHIEDLKGLKAGETKSIIFDDMDFQHWPRTSQIHLLDSTLPRSINVRYGVVHIPAGITKIFTANSAPFSSDPAIDRRINLINALG